MSDEAARKTGNEDELLDDFNEVINDLGADGSQQNGGGDDLDELEAFLDDFDDNAEARSSADPGTPAADNLDGLADFDELSVDTGDLDEDDLDLSDAAAGPEPRTGQADLDLDREPEPAAFPASAPLNQAPASSSAAAASSPDNRSGGRDAGGAALAFGVVGMVLALAAGGYAWMVSVGLSEMEQRLTGVEAVAGRTAGGGSMADVLRAQQQLRDRVDELAIILDGPLGHLQEGNRRELAGLAARVSELESAIKGVDESVAELDVKLTTLSQAPAPAAARPAAAPAQTAAARPGAGNWVVNLASLTDRKAAEAEVARLAKAGIKAEVNIAKSGGRTWYRVRVPGFKDSTTAREYARKDAAKAGYPNAWIATR